MSNFNKIMITWVQVTTTWTPNFYLANWISSQQLLGSTVFTIFLGSTGLCLEHVEPYEWVLANSVQRKYLMIWVCPLVHDFTITEHTFQFLLLGRWLTSVFFYRVFYDNFLRQKKKNYGNSNNFTMPKYNLQKKFF